MAIVLALMSALSYGISDFVAGLQSRRTDSRVVTLYTQGLGFLAAIVAVIVFPGRGPSAAALEWGALSGVGSAVGSLALYRGLALGQMSVVASLCGVLTSVIPAVVGIASGNHLSALAATGIALTIPAVALASWQNSAAPSAGDRASIGYGALAGLGFGFLFVALDHAGGHNGAWPVLPGQGVSLLLVVPFAWRGLRTGRLPAGRATSLMIVAGLLSGAANLLFLAAAGHGELAIVGVLSSLYPAGTVMMARAVLGERWTRIQGAGMLAAAGAVVLISVG